MLIVGNIIGIGIFTTTGYIARYISEPGLMIFIWIVGGLGLIGIVIAFIAGILPPTEIFSGGRVFGYVGAILLGTFLLAIPPLIFLKLKKPSWKPNVEAKP